MKKVIKRLQKNKAAYVSLVGLLLIVGFFLLRGSSEEESASSFTIVQAVERGDVSSGIETTGTVVAARKLDLDVYKQLERIEVVNVANGDSVKKGDVLFSFDKSVANVAVQSSRVKLNEAKLELGEENQNYNDPSTEIKTIDQSIRDLEISIKQADQDKVDARKTYLNTSLSAKALGDDSFDRSAPVISGYYNGSETGEYVIEVYASSATSGYSFRLKGLESKTESLYISSVIDLGEYGLEVSFPVDTKNGDEWAVSVPNIRSPFYAQNRRDYERKILDLDKSLDGYRRQLEIQKINLEDEEFVDSVDYRNLSLSRARAKLSQARVELSENYEVVQDQDIVAPFDGTIEGLNNVVVGATPTRDTEDPISFGTLISGQFLVDFSLSAVNVSKIEIGQSALVTITSFPNVPPLEAVVIEISSLPDSDSVAQYGVQALVTPREGVVLREGLLADIEIVEEIAIDVVRVPKSALHYKDGKAYVDAIDSLSEEQRKGVDDMGIVRSEGGKFPSFPVSVEVGLEGVFYSEITSGLSAGQEIIVTSSGEDSGNVTQESFGRPRGGEGDSTSRGSSGGERPSRQ